MNKNKVITKISDVLLYIGIALIVVSAVLTAILSVNQSVSEKEVGKITEQIYSLIPDIQNGLPEQRENKTMPMVEIDGNNFIGVIEIPLYNRKLPVYYSWEPSKTTWFPCRYTGSIYGDCLVIGGSDNKEQFDFMRDISIDDQLYFTDTTGMRYSYRIERIEISKDISTENLMKDKNDLVIFARNKSSLDYTIIRCTLS